MQNEQNGAERAEAKKTSAASALSSTAATDRRDTSGAGTRHMTAGNRRAVCRSVRCQTTEGR